MSRLPQGLHLHFDPLSGIAGDMTVAALVDAGVPRAVVSEAIATLKVPGLKVRFERRQRGAYVGTGFVVGWPGKVAKGKGKGKAKTKQKQHHEHFHEASPHDLVLRQPHVHDHHHDVPDHDHGHDHDHDHDHAHAHGHHDGHDHDHDHDDHDHAHEHHAHDHRDYAEIKRLLKRAALDADAKALAGDIFARVAEAEAALHGKPVDSIAFHEVGAYDSIADIVGAAAAIAWLAPSAVSSTPPVLGTGYVRTAHGLVPVPAPATAALLAGAPVRAEGQGELTTPTGAAVLAAIVDRFGALPPVRLLAQGFGAGTRELTDRANVLRVMIGEPIGQALPDSAEQVTLLQANIDDMNPQLVEPLLEALFGAGALDVWSTPIVMKKGRPALEVSVLAAPATVPVIARALFENSTTIGLRSSVLARTVLARSTATVSTPYGKVAVKVAALEGQVLGATPEFEDCRRLARKAGVPVRAVLSAAAGAAALTLGPKAPKAKR